MPKLFSDLKHVYKKTYDELKNPKSPIAVFLAKIDRHEIKEPQVVKDAIKEFIKVYEAEEKNFVEPDVSDGRISYRAEQARLKKNLEVEKKLADAVQKMQDALDILAENNLSQRVEYTPEQIHAMKDRKEQLKAQRERVLNAAYKLEVEEEERMIKKLKAEFKAFDHRPIESKVDLPPYILDSAPYRFRHMEANGSLEIPTALYGLMRFRDLLNEHEEMVEEAQRSRQYEKYVNDRLAGFLAWKNTLERETEIYDEISKAIEPQYFEEYNAFMDDYPGTSAAEGYLQWFKKKHLEILNMEDEIKELQGEVEAYQKEYSDLEVDYKKLIEALEIERIMYDEKLKEAENNELLAPGFAENNENTKTVLEAQLKELEEELKNLDDEIGSISQEHNATRDAMVERARQVLTYSDELNKLQESLTADAKNALQDFLQNYETGVKHLDATLNDNLDAIKRMAEELNSHNDNIEEAEKDIEAYSKQVNERRMQLDEITRAYNEAKEKSQLDLKNQTGIRKFFQRNIGANKEVHRANLQAAEEQKAMLEAYEQEIEKLQTNVEALENILKERQDQLEAYKLGWNSVITPLKETIKDSCEYTQELQEKLGQQAAEAEKANQEYDDKVKEIQKDVDEKQRGSQSILDKASSDLDRLNAKKIQKTAERKLILDQMKETKEKIEACNLTSDHIQNAKDSLEALKNAKEEFEKNKPEKIRQAERDLEISTERVSHGQKLLAEKRIESEAKIHGYRTLKEFYDQKKVTSNRILRDLTDALTESLNIARDESQKQLAYISEKENKLINKFTDKMINTNAFADRSKVMGSDNKVDGSVYSYMKHINSY